MSAYTKPTWLYPFPASGLKSAAKSRPNFVLLSTVQSRSFPAAPPDHGPPSQAGMSWTCTCRTPWQPWQPHPGLPPPCVSSRPRFQPFSDSLRAPPSSDSAAYAVMACGQDTFYGTFAKRRPLGVAPGLWVLCLIESTTGFVNLPGPQLRRGGRGQGRHLFPHAPEFLLQEISIVGRIFHGRSPQTCFRRSLRQSEEKTLTRLRLPSGHAIQPCYCVAFQVFDPLCSRARPRAVT